MRTKWSKKKMPLMIMSLLPVTEDADHSTGYFDYGACIYPYGIVKNEMLYFNEEDIAEVLFEGYHTSNEQQFLKKITNDVDEHKKEYHHFSIEEFMK